MLSNSQSQDEQKFTGKHMLAIMVAFFGVIIAVNVTMATMAGGTWTGLVVKNSYVASQKFNTELKQAQAQKATGLHSELSYADGELNFVLKDREGNRITATNLQVEIGRPAFEQADQKLALVSAADNSYKLGIDLAQGRWAVRITGQSDQHHYRRDARLYVGADGRGELE